MVFLMYRKRAMQKLGVKLTIIAMVCVIFFVGLLFVSGLVDERHSYHQSVIDEIKEAHVKDQLVITPFLVMETDKGETLIFPTQSELDMTMGVRDDEYERGIYRAINYHGDIGIKQQFILPTPNTPTPPKGAKAPTVKTLSLFISASDLRGLVAKEITINGKSYPAKFAKHHKFGVGHLMVNISDQLSQPSITSHATLSLSGIGQVSVLPLGTQFGASMSSNWHEPKFFGQALPVSKEFSADGAGFVAKWQGGFIAEQNEASLLNCAVSDTSACPILEQLPHSSHYHTFGTEFVKTNDAYAHTDRSIKYALLIVMVSFGTFFLMEIIKGLRIHPISYLLVASALLVFYLLLLSLAEHMAFLSAYVIASTACVSLIGWYARYLLGSVGRGVAFGGLLGVLYGAFYVILSASGLNLLMGSVFAFVCIAVAMMVTRHVDWYALTANKTDQPQGE